MNRPDQARITRVHADLRVIEGALNTYRLDNFNYPSAEQGLEALVNRPDGQPEPRNWAAGGYLPRLPRDPWGNPYQYLNPGVRGEIDIWSFGADGQPGGENMNADIGNWSLDG
jgi:general secretion pathway protein G